MRLTFGLPIKVDERAVVSHGVSGETHKGVRAGCGVAIWANGRFLPHPCPLPLGEGECSPPARLGGAASCQRARTHWPPLPAGEGWGEGEQPQSFKREPSAPRHGAAGGKGHHHRLHQVPTNRPRMGRLQRQRHRHRYRHPLLHRCQVFQEGEEAVGRIPEDSGIPPSRPCLL